MPGRQAGRKTRTRLVWVRVCIAIAALGLIFSRIDFEASTVRLTPSLLLAVIGAAGLLILSQAVAALRWKSILGDERLPWSYLMRLYLIGSFFGLFLPTSVGGDAVRAIAAARSSAHAGRTMASVLVDRGFGVAASLAYVALGLCLAPQLLGEFDAGMMRFSIPVLAVPAFAFLAAGLVGMSLSRSTRARALWNQGIVAVGDLARSPRRLAWVLALALVCQGLIVVLWYILARGVHFSLPPSTFLWTVPLVGLCALLPVTFAGLGVREGVWLVLLKSSGIPPADIVAFSLLYFVCGLLVGVSGGLLFVLSGTGLVPPHGARA